MGERVRVLDNFSSGKRENLHGLEDRVEVIVGDLLNQGVLRKAMEGVEVVFHQAALRSVPFSVENPALVNRVTLPSTLRGEWSTPPLPRYTEIVWSYRRANTLCPDRSHLMPF